VGKVGAMDFTLDFVSSSVFPLSETVVGLCKKGLFSILVLPNIFLLATFDSMFPKTDLPLSAVTSVLPNTVLEFSAFCSALLNIDLVFAVMLKNIDFSGFHSVPVFKADFVFVFKLLNGDFFSLSLFLVYYRFVQPASCVPKCARSVPWYFLLSM